MCLFAAGSVMLSVGLPDHLTSRLLPPERIHRGCERAFDFKFQTIPSTYEDFFFILFFTSSTSQSNRKTTLFFIVRTISSPTTILSPPKSPDGRTKLQPYPRPCVVQRNCLTASSHPSDVSNLSLSANSLYSTSPARITELLPSSTHLLIHLPDQQSNHSSKPTPSCPCSPPSA